MWWMIGPDRFRSGFRVGGQFHTSARTIGYCFPMLCLFIEEAFWHYLAEVEVSPP